MARNVFKRPGLWLGFPFLWALLAVIPVEAQTNSNGDLWSSAVVDYDHIIEAEGYLRPPAIIEQAVLAPRHLQVSLSNLNAPMGTTFLNSLGDVMPSLEHFARPHYDLAGWQIDYIANRSRNLTSRGNNGLELIRATTGERVAVQVPDGARVSGQRWSPDGSRVAFYAHFETETHIYVADVSNGRSRQVTPRPVLATHVTSFDWTADGEHIITVLLPANRGPVPVAGATPETPVVRIARPAEENRLRTYFSLLENPYDMELVKYYSTGQLAKVNVGNRRVQEIGEPAMIRGVNASPAGTHFRITTMYEPFSYIVPLSNFGTAERIWSDAGEVLHTLSERELREGVSGQGGGSGNDNGAPARRSMSWIPDGSGIVYFQRAPAPEDADEDEEAGDRMDRIVHWFPPFADDSYEVMFENQNEITGVRYSDDGQILFITERVRNQNHVFAVDLSDPSTRYTITRSGNNQPDGAPRGSLLTTTGSHGSTVVRMSPDSRYVYLSGTDRPESDDEDAQEEEEREPPRPFIDRFDFRTSELTRVYEGNPDYTESIQAVLDDEISQVVVSRQTRDMVPQSFLVEVATGAERQLTQNQEFTLDELKNTETRTLFATRADGVRVRVRVTLPGDFQEGDRLPAMFWFYPREYTSREAYERTYAGSGGGDGAAGPGRYPSVGASSVRLLTLQGYAVVEPDAPIIGPQGRMNDNYITDLRNNLAAVIDVLDREGIIDRDRLGIGGHSYGGFGTGNVLAHTPFFRAGIAGASNFNRLLTPLGFQSERRDLWAGRETYLQMSPFLYANQINAALLMYHGMQDSNVGTHPLNSERMFHALNGLGKTAALYMYPYEAHGQATMETRLDMWARWIAWLDKYVKYKGEPPEAVTTDADTDGEDSASDR
jgi:dipeptidyl aminopeptidase/acylaminoacyl peptidase